VRSISPRQRFALACGSSSQMIAISDLWRVV
jgi:hypothetical protein